MIIYGESTFRLRETETGHHPSPLLGIAATFSILTHRSEVGHYGFYKLYAPPCGIDCGQSVD